MTAPRDADRLIQAFLSEGETDLPDRAFEAVRRDIHRTHQRVVLGPWREPHMSTVARLAIAAAAVVAIGLAWINFGPSQDKKGVGAPQTPTPTATTAPTPSASPRVLPNSGAIEPGTYWLNAVGVADVFLLPQIAVTLPAGWTADGDGLFKNYAPDLNPGELDASDAGAGPALVAWQMNGTFVDPCTNHTLVKPTPGPGVDALADAFAHQPGTTAGPPTAVTVDGYSGKFVELTVTADVTKCPRFSIWASPDGNDRFVQGTNEMNRMYILDVEGHRFTFNARIPARTTAADRAEFEAIIASMDIQP
jgi:hypothetical protein